MDTLVAGPTKRDSSRNGGKLYTLDKRGETIFNLYVSSLTAVRQNGKIRDKEDDSTLIQVSFKKVSCIKYSLGEKCLHVFNITHVQKPIQNARESYFSLFQLYK